MTDIAYTILPSGPEVPWMGGNIVYFMYSGGRIKIGYSGTVAGRLKRLRTAGPFAPAVLLVMRGNKGVESDLHVRFHADRLHGEWFALSAELRRFLNSRLCDVGLATLDRAEAEFRAYCETILGRQAPPRKRKPRLLCPHERPIGSLCAPCERERDLKILEQINAGTYQMPDVSSILERA